MKQNKKKIGLVLSSALTASGAVVGALIGLSSCSNVKTIPVKYLQTNDQGLITGISLSEDEIRQYNNLIIPEKDANDKAITGIAAEAFKDKIRSETINGEFAMTLVIKKNVKKIGANAFYGCTGITTIDLSDFEKADDIFTLFEDNNMGENAFALTNTKLQGTLKLNSKITSTEEINDIKTCLVAFGVPVKWFKEGQEPTISKLSLSGGSTKLSGKQYYASNDQNTWKVNYGGAEDVSSKCAYAIIPLSTSFPTGKITVEKDVVSGQARVKWDNTLEPGTYAFAVGTAYVRAGEATTLRAVSKEILITVTQTQFKLSGPTSFSGKSYKAGTDTTNKFATFVDGASVDSTYEIVDSTAGAGKITIANNGVVSWGELAVGAYTFKVKAIHYLTDLLGNVTELTKTSENVLLGITDRKVNITNATFPAELKELESGTSLTPFTATVTDNAYNATTWELHMLKGPSLTSISVDANSGYVRWDENIPAGEYQFYVTANVDGKWSGTSQTITLNFGQKAAEIQGGEDELPSYDYTSGIGAARQMYIDGRLIENAKWSIETLGTPIPSTIKINDNGQVYWDESIGAGTYTFRVHGQKEYLGIVRDAYQEVSLIVATKTYTVSGGNYEMTIDEYTWGQDTAKWKAEAPAVNAETYEWSLEATGGTELPSGLKINNEGLIYWDDTVPANTYKFYVNVLVNDHWHGRTYKPVTLQVVSKTLAVDDSGITKAIESKDYTSGVSDEAIKVLLKGSTSGTSIDVTDAAEFELINTGLKALPSSLKVNKQGKFTWGDDVEEGTYTFKVKATYTHHGKTISAESANAITFNVTVTSIVISQSVAKSTFKGDVLASKIDKSTQFSITKDGQPYTDMSNVVWHFTDSTGTVPVLEGKLHMTEEGYLNWDKIAVGNYSFYVWCEVEGKWWGYFGTEITLQIAAEHDLTNSDLILDDNNVVKGLETDISGYTSEHSLTIDIDGDAVENIESLVGIANNEKITELIINNSSTNTISLDGLQGSPMFGLTNLKKITLNNTSTGTIEIGQYAFPNSSFTTCSTLILKGVTIKEHAFSQWTSLIDVQISNSGSIGTGAFYGAGATAGMTVTGLADILANDDVTLGTNVFDTSNISYTGDLTIGRSIPSYTFSGCQNFAPDIKVKGAAWFNTYSMANTLTKSIEFAADASGARVDANAFSGCALLSSLTFLTTINIIESNAFAACSALTLIDVSTLSGLSEYKLATTMQDSALNGVAEKGEFKCKDKQQAAYWMESMYSKYGLPTGWIFSPEGAWRLDYNCSSDIVLDNTPGFVDFNSTLTINYTLPETRQLKKVSCQVSWGSTVLNDETEKLYPECFKLTDGQIYIDLLTLESKGIAMPTDGEHVIITLVSMDKQTLTYSGTKTYLAEQTESLSSNFTTTILGFKTTNVTIDNLTVAGNLTKDGVAVSTDAYTLSIKKSSSTSFNLVVSIKKDAIAQSGFKLDGAFTFTDKVNHTSWTISDFIIYVDYQTKVLTNSDFLTSSGTISSLVTTLESNYYYNVELELDGVTYTNIGANLLNSVTNGNMINSIKITNKVANTNQIDLKATMFAACTDLRHLILVNQAESPAMMLVSEQILPTECLDDMLDIEVDNCNLSYAFNGLSNLNKITVGKGSVLGTASFVDCINVQTLDLSTWDAITETEDWSKTCFANLATFTSGTKYIRVYSASAKELWSSYFTTLGCLNPSQWTFKY